MKETIALRKNPDMVTRVIEDETILLPIYKTSDEINCIYTLNKVASRVWEMFDGKKTVGEIKKQILKEFDTTPKEVEKKNAGAIKRFKRDKGDHYAKNRRKKKVMKNEEETKI